MAREEEVKRRRARMVPERDDEERGESERRRG